MGANLTWVKESRLCLQCHSVCTVGFLERHRASAQPGLQCAGDDNFFPLCHLEIWGALGDEQLLVGTVTLWIYFVCFERELAEFADGLGVWHVA